VSDIPDFKSTNDEEIYQTIFSEKLNDYYMLMSAVRARFFPNYNWDQLTGDTLSVLRDMTAMLVYNTTEEFRKQVPDYEDEVFIPKSTFQDQVTKALKEAFEEFKNN
jgi:hypothetical protein